jgi:hypothetical protein
MVSEISNIITNLDSSLLADNLAAKGESLPLPSNQWILEAQNWFSISMNNIQRLLVTTATGPTGSDAADAQYTRDMANGRPAFSQFCRSQIIHREDFTNFSVLALAIIFGVGCAVICVSLVLESALGYAQSHFKRGLYRRLRWQLESTIQLQRMAFEEVGLGTWSGGAKEVPVTEKGEEFEFWPEAGTDEQHLRIRGERNSV